MFGRQEKVTRVNERRFLKMIQHRTARVAVGASATRGQGAKGIVAAAREFMGDLPLAPFGTSDQMAYARQLDAATLGLKDFLPWGAKTWGLSRKLLNIFLRDCFYTTYLARAYNLKAAERFMEIPLDSITAKGIREKDRALPRWTGVKYLDQAVSAAYQAAALMLAEKRGMARVHLDADFWGDRE